MRVGDVVHLRDTTEAVVTRLRDGYSGGAEMIEVKLPSRVFPCWIPVADLIESDG